ncbi:hypothetical protein [Chitinophaga nivalis]|uniref:Leucine-rich repeat domain-containing protein n=1 Tax=Chitinophaga nivalis TaxID=2991709 RepID=A0ABT3IIV5_9BACT|nr:hypothetical protein [Chitinophaga nivalis]MCW3466440.1 hypothetical protein [Chitinophaga nivalis]MCW3483869.1 hypothetical protein [Chitinophaga nivalis]
MLQSGNTIFELGKDIDPDIPTLQANKITDLENTELMAGKQVLQINDELPASSMLAVARAIHQYPHLQLRFYAAANISQIDWPAFAHVRHLSIGGNAGNWTSLNFLEQLPLLETLIIHAPLKCKTSLLPLQKLQQLKRLNLINIQQDLDKIVWANGLDTLGLTVGELKNSGLLTNIPFIKNLCLNFTQLADYKVLAHITGLQVLSLIGLKGFSQQHAAELQHIPALQLLEISRCPKITDIAFTADLQALKKLRLANIKVASFAPLTGHPALQVISTDTVQPDNTALTGVYHIPHVYLSGRFPAEEITRFQSGFTGQDAVIGGALLKGTLKENNFIYHIHQVTAL